MLEIQCPNCNTKHIPEYNIQPSDKRVFKGQCKNCNSTLKFKQNHYDNKGMLERDNISFHVNGTQYTVGSDFPLTMTFNDYLRNQLHMTGTKVTCKEGGCGACLVNAEINDYTTQKKKNISINSCLLPLYACDGWNFTTIEGIESNGQKLAEIPKRIVEKNGTQCGWCTPGMVMNMYSLLSDNPQPSEVTIENNFDGNLCRCTGYRSILDAMKSFAVNKNPIDIEELSQLKCLNVNTSCCQSKKNVHLINNDASEWFTPQDMESLYALLVKYQGQSYKLVSGNTGTGVYKNDGPFNTFIYIKNIPELYQINRSGLRLEFGALLSLRSVIELFNEYSVQSGFEYLSTIAAHLKKIANVSVRNSGTWSGNLRMKHDHPDFASDAFICLETIGAVLKIVGPDKNTPPVEVTPLEFLKTPMTGKLIYSARVTPFDPSSTYIKTYKIMPRSQNAHAYVNAGFRFNIDRKTFMVKSQPTIVFGGISDTFVHARDTESYLVGKNLNDQNVLNAAFEILFKEIVPTNDPVLASPDYRRSLAISLFYKFILFVNQNVINPKYKSALDSVIDQRGLSSGQQSFPEDENLYPVTKPMSKLNAYLQATGKAQYTYDKVPLKNQLEGAFIQSTIGACKIDTIDTSVAETMPGVVKIILSKDIPAANSFMSAPFSPEILFAYDTVDYAGQPIGLVIAETQYQAQMAAKAVKVTYKEKQTPILNVFDAIKAKSFFPNPPDFKYGDAEEAIAKAPISFDGESFLDTQFHFFMESHVTVCEETEDGIDVHCATQWTNQLQSAIAAALGLKNVSSVNVKVQQLGGAYGGKLTRSNITAVAAAVACKVVKRPVRVQLDLNTTMSIHGKRFAWYSKYKVGCDEKGKILGIIINWYNDCGNSPNDTTILIGPNFVDNVYKVPNWHLINNLAKTNLPANSFVRSPGFFQTIAIMEMIIEHMATHLKMDPFEIRMSNLYTKSDVTPMGQPLKYFNADVIMKELRETTDYDKRVLDIQKYNTENRWKKRGISITPIKWGLDLRGANYNCMMAIYGADGSIALTHGGVEMGQGIDTKVAQVCAYGLKVPLDIISIKHSETFTNANAAPTGGSITTESVAKAVLRCCEIMNERLAPIRDLMPVGYTWTQLIQKATSMGIDLSARYWINDDQETPFSYEIYAAACSEAIVDVLTGETQILRTDILYDCGQCLNGEIDIGQAEGAFVMGMGFWLHEKARYDPQTGLCLTNGTWEYKPPSTKDIPLDFRVRFMKNNPNPVGFLGSKAIGEPPLCLSPSIAFAAKRAIEAARSEVKNTSFFSLDSPATVDQIQKYCLVDYTQFKLN